MKKTIAMVSIFFMILCLLGNPSLISQAVTDGLIIWYKKILPSLLPFCIFSNLLLDTGLLKGITIGLYPVFAGFLFGFPIGSKITADLLRKNELSEDVASVLFYVTNNISPAFISSVIIDKILGYHFPAILFFLTVYLPPALYGILRFLISQKTPLFSSRPVITGIKKAAQPAHFDFAMIDTAIMNAFDVMLRLAGYIILFSIAASLIHVLPLHNELLNASVISLLELTNGTATIETLLIPERTKFIMLAFFTSFGGISGIFQTSSMIQDTALSMKKYILHRIAFAICTLFLASLITYANC